MVLPEITYIPPHLVGMPNTRGNAAFARSLR